MAAAKKTTDQFEREIEGARLEIADLQNRIREMIVRRNQAQKVSDARDAHDQRSFSVEHLLSGQCHDGVV